jgi:crotonobetainyl-CoA:carnitine CoA-transferase CaiB-like acyl-CoA transferase
MIRRMPEVLAGIRVLDLTTGPVGGFATAVLADFGADVLKVEPPGGDRFRSLASAPLWLRGKRSAVLDLGRSAAARAQLHACIASADVLVVSGPPGRAARLGADAGTAERLQPRIVHCSITPWGPSGKYALDPGYDGLVMARAGRMRCFERLLPGARRPVYAAVRVAAHGAAQGAVQGICAALIARERTGRAQRVETSLLQGLLPYELIELLATQLAERRGQPVPNISDLTGELPTLNFLPVQTADGRWLQNGNFFEHLFLAFLDAIDLLPELLAEPRYQGPPGSWDVAAVDAARDRILLRMRERPLEFWMERFRRNGNIAAEPYLDTREALAHPDLVANGDVIEIRDPALGPVRQIGPIAQLERTPARPARPAPAIGEHGAVWPGEPRAHPAPREARAQPAPGRPLAGITVLEVATVIAAPLSTTFLSDLGARVIKLEAPGGDPYRQLAPEGTAGVKTNAGKESLCVDLKSDAGRAIARALALRSDVLLHNLRPGVPERLGLGWPELHALHPGLIWVALSGYGPGSPGAARPSMHPVPGAAMGGAGYQAGGALARRCETLDEVRETSRQLTRANESNPDPNSAVVAASATLLALLARERHGIGQAVYVNMLVANAWANGDDFLDYAGKPPRPALGAELTGPAAGYRLYRAQDGWIFLALTTDAEWSRFFAAIARPDLAGDPRFATASARAESDAALGAELARLFATRPADAWETSLGAARVGCVRADGPTPGPFFAHDPHVRENGFTPGCVHARFGPYRRWGPLVSVGGLAPAYGPGSLAGDHTDALLAELGYSAGDVERLRKSGIVGSEPV